MTDDVVDVGWIMTLSMQVQGSERVLIEAGLVLKISRFLYQILR
jgi:hypothetical protein